MPSRFTQYGGVQGADDALTQMVMQRIAAEMEARKRAVEDYKLGQTDRGLQLEGGRLAEDARQFNEQAPNREANVGYLRTQADHLKGANTRAADERAQQAFMAQAKQADELAQIEARGAQERKTAQATAGLRTTNDRLVQVMGPNGVPIWKRESEAADMPAAQAARAVTGQERGVLGYFNRMVEAERNARAVEDKLKPSDVGAMSYAPDFLENWLKTPEGQQYTQAQRMYTEARLRKESGAAIPTSEYDNDKRTNFRIAADTPETIAQKRRSRLTTMRGLGNSAGRALQEYYGEGATLDQLLKEFEDAQAAAPAVKPTIKSIRQVR